MYSLAAEVILKSALLFSGSPKYRITEAGIVAKYQSLDYRITGD